MLNNQRVRTILASEQFPKSLMILQRCSTVVNYIAQYAGDNILSSDQKNLAVFDDCSHVFNGDKIGDIGICMASNLLCVYRFMILAGCTTQSIRDVHYLLHMGIPFTTAISIIHIYIYMYIRVYIYIYVDIYIYMYVM